MRFIKLLTIFGVIALFSANSFAQCGGKSAEKTAEKSGCGSCAHACDTATDNAVETGKMTVIDLPTVQCNMCKSGIEKKLSKVEGIQSVRVNVKKKAAMVNYDPEKTDVAKIEKAISAIGYQANKTEADKKAYAKLADCCKVADQS